MAQSECPRFSLDLLHLEALCNHLPLPLNFYPTEFSLHRLSNSLSRSLFSVQLLFDFSVCPQPAVALLITASVIPAR